MSQPACMAPAWVARNIGWRTSSPDGRWKAPASQERDQRHSPNMKPVTADDSKSEEQPWQAVWTYVIAGFSGQPGTQRRARSHRTRTHCRRMVCAKRTSSSRQSRLYVARRWWRVMSSSRARRLPSVTILCSGARSRVARDAGRRLPSKRPAWRYVLTYLSGCPFVVPGLAVGGRVSDGSPTTCSDHGGRVPVYIDRGVLAQRPARAATPRAASVLAAFGEPRARRAVVA
jgi:hypothetical protein